MWSQSDAFRQIRRMTHDSDLKFCVQWHVCKLKYESQNFSFFFFIKTLVSFWEENRIETPWKKRIETKVILRRELEETNSVGKKKTQIQVTFSRYRGC